MEQIITAAINCGFSRCKPLKPATLRPLPQVRQMCQADRCRAWNKSWSCPPACGTLEACTARLTAYREGVLVQTTGMLEDPFDYESMMETEAKHKAAFQKLHRLLRQQFPDLLALGAGCCTLCQSCTYPDTPCRFPEEMTSAMEAYGLMVSQVCKENGLGYNYGENTVTFTSCFLLNR